MSKNIANKELVPLFGRSDDMRVKLLIDELRNQSIMTSGSYTTVQISKITPAFQNMYFKLPTKNKKYIADIEIHSEWFDFASHLGNRFKAAVSTDALNIIKRLGNNGNAAIPGSDIEFGQKLVVILFSDIKDATGAKILNNPTKWGNAVSANYEISANIAANLFNPKGDAGILQLGAQLAAAANPDNTSIKEFSYNYTKFWLRTMMETHAASASTPVAPSSFFNDDVLPSDEVYFRKGSELYYIDDKGVEVRVDFGSKAAQALTTDAKCLGTGYVEYPNPGETCADYLRDCLSGKDVTKCKTYLGDAKFWENAVDEVEKMLPGIAVQTLNAFEFGMEEVWDNTANRRLLKYKSAETWVNGLAELNKTKTPPMAQTEIDAIQKNTKLLGYLNLLVKKINSSPAILNKDYTGLTDSNKINDIDAFAGSRLHKMGVKARLATNNLSVSSIDKLSQAIKDSNARLSLTLGLPGLYGYSNKFNFSLSGGSSSLEYLEDKVSDETKHTAHIIERQFAELNIRLSKYGKQITREDLEKIKNLIESLKKSEDKLNKAILYTEKYARLLEVHGQKDNTNILSMDHLQQFVDNRNKYFARVSKKQNDLMSIIRTIAEAVNKETPSVDAEMKALNVDPKSIDFGSLLG
jgi:hypothetical protein